MPGGSLRLDRQPPKVSDGAVAPTGSFARSLISRSLLNGIGLSIAQFTIQI